MGHEGAADTGIHQDKPFIPILQHPPAILHSGQNLCVGPQVKTRILPLDDPDIGTSDREDLCVDVCLAIEDEDEICGIVKPVVDEEGEVDAPEFGLAVGVED